MASTRPHLPPSVVSGTPSPSAISGVRHATPYPPLLLDHHPWLRFTRLPCPRCNTPLPPPPYKQALPSPPQYYKIRYSSEYRYYPLAYMRRGRDLTILLFKIGEQPEYFCSKILRLQQEINLSGETVSPKRLVFRYMKALPNIDKLNVFIVPKMIDLITFPEKRKIGYIHSVKCPWTLYLSRNDWIPN